MFARFLGLVLQADAEVYQPPLESSHEPEEGEEGGESRAGVLESDLAQTRCGLEVISAIEDFSSRVLRHALQ